MTYNEQFNPITIIGAGVIGTSWAALFLANGYEVRINDISETLEYDVKNGIKNIESTLKDLGYDTTDLYEKLIIEKDQYQAVKGAKIIQENGPENVEFKQNLYQNLEEYADEETIFLTSSSSIPASIISEKMHNPERMCVGHPFNPPHLIPLVEIVPGKATSKSTLIKAKEFYESLGKSPIILKKEINGFVANRLQAAIFQECVHLVLEGVVNPKDLDTVVDRSIGLRWAADGPFLSFHLGGGNGGFEHFMQHLGKNMPELWKDLGHPELNEENINKLIDVVNLDYGDTSIKILEEKRDHKQLKIIKDLISRGEDFND
ncbi:3-hydroxyacyl-CoA dehydrogenase NAD-binding domain-containing protein [Staphylococcus succinus]|uniref:3-hydroxyacyl-CoA dehydrogenase NAD-binding domain-containing protein n=1 Tax=Staphylococcus succinus TaxID=61015 RepID=UPI000B0BD4A0|nr:3-hydroxyacyl-CoA dehydrogenase NAD-binding domain-containing protein [Staphylococcus succinus]MBU0439349.1 hypothetical protein [Staphylococcus succinus]